MSKELARRIDSISSFEIIRLPATPEPVVVDAPPVPVLVLVKLLRSVAPPPPPPRSDPPSELLLRDPTELADGDLRMPAGTGGSFIRRFR